ncbi:tagaturonate reductase [Bifidobacterium choloepi]|uniref:Tagaturonate reductase n=1 Tax=Bifidobacterium choloepi TaxID=2614131 RepID=A0A6I5MY22_9BIFI|nr:tagaturonate reductase [Bifidobacterium choloepi]NEG69498.1 tagaturonate reductase [Bifidobacterium choloepi]
MEQLTIATAPEHDRIVADRQRPIRVVQFGEGNFLRAFVDWSIQQMNDHGDFDGNIAIVQPLPKGRVADLDAQDDLYTVILEGLKDGRPVQRHDLIDSVATTVNPYDDWEAYLALADNPDLKVIVSNTTEAGIATSDADSPDACPPDSYPAKLLMLLKRRYDKNLPGLLIIPCELIEDNGTHLEECLIATADKFGYDQDFIDWLRRDNVFATTLVDRIVPGYPADRADELCNELGYRDTSLVKAEPFGLWVLGGDEEVRRTLREILPTDAVDMDIVVTGDVQPYRERKVFLLNGPHTTMALVARLLGFETVGQVIDDPAMRCFIEREMDEEIIPVINLPKDELDQFAAAVLERFANPFVRHELDSIALNSVSKFTARLLPIVHKNAEQGRPVPRRIALALAALIVSYANLTGADVTVTDMPSVTERLAAVTTDPESIRAVLADSTLWGEDLTKLDGFADLVVDDVLAIVDGRLPELEVSLA